jgi:hypothetical protein
LVLALLAAGGVAGCGEERVVPEHGVVPAGFPGRLRLRVEHSLAGLLPLGAAGREVVAETDGRVVGGARTGGDGHATLAVGTLSAGVHDVTVRVGERAAALQVLAVPIGGGLILCDIDGTIYLEGKGEASAGPGTGVEHAWPDAAVVLKRLARWYGIVYVTAREEGFRSRTREFLEGAGFPPGPLVMWDLATDPISRVAIKTKKLLALKADWPALAWGVGDRASDCAAYGACGVPWILLDPRAGDDAPSAGEGGGVAGSWKEVEAIIRSRAESLPGPKSPAEVPGGERDAGSSRASSR